MKSRILKTALLVTVLLAMIATPVLAAAPGEEPPVGVSFDVLLAQWAGLTGFSAAIVFLINIGKKIGWVKDGQAQTLSAGLNLLFLAGLLAARVFRPDLDVASLDAQVGSAVEAGVVVFTWVLQLLASKAVHFGVKGLPVIGTSYSLMMQKRM